MKIKVIVLMMMLLVVVSSVGLGEVIDRKHFEDFTTVKEITFLVEDGWHVEYTLILPDLKVGYPRNNLELEEKLSGDYTLIYVRGFMIDSYYKLKNEIELEVNGEVYKPIDFYDFRADRNERFGYLLFPQIELEGELILRTRMNEHKIDYETIKKLANVLRP